MGGMANTQTAKRASSGRTVHTMKISLLDSKPPIWRRLEVPSGSTLHELHEIIQGAFGWEECHMWVFETPMGEYGVADPELRHRSAASKKLDGVAPRVGDRLRYTYDFGDDWVHDILIEDVHAAEPGVTYPRCLTGRRACPPEDCGGIGGYEMLVEILAAPRTTRTRKCSGLDSADVFDPAAFDVAEVNEALSGIGTVLVKG